LKRDQRNEALTAQHIRKSLDSHAAVPQWFYTHTHIRYYSLKKIGEAAYFYQIAFLK
jgi:hypothetical protein